MSGELTDEKLGAMVMAGIGAFQHGSVTPFSAQDIGACALMVGGLRNEVAALRAVLNDLLLTRQAQQDASGEHFDRLLADDGSPEDAQRCEEASDREAKATLAHLAAWDRARSLLAGEEQP